ncbi:uncharacterized protein LOC113503397 [Trichoplusia ni]|uniref:Uncharacterized protein LOC113503397 n=1 Tax=Trichoplusia ni TaxID=7111 RepID=A0A7E5WLX5_TRINI|nr:uncharacterized protein LOC113503397 [Trichoplusia ni]
MPLDYTDPVTLKCIIERNGYENRERVRWFLKHKDEQIARAQFTERHHQRTENDILKHDVEHSIQALKIQHDENNKHRRRKPQLETYLNPLADKPEPDEPVMKPVEHEVSNLHYKPLTLGGGRKTYLSARNLKMPEDKYNSCPTSSVYGWRLNDSDLTYGFSKHSKYDAFFHDLYRLSGVHPDPPHYEPPTERIYKRCVGSE